MKIGDILFIASVLFLGYIVISVLMTDYYDYNKVVRHKICASLMWPVILILWFVKFICSLPKSLKEFCVTIYETIEDIVKYWWRV